MARTFALPEGDYTVRQYGPLTINGFVGTDTDWLEATFTVVDWPEASPLFTGELRWNTGDGANFEVNWPQTARNGDPLTVVRVRVSVPQTADGKAAVTSATVVFDVKAPFRTAVNVAAVVNG